MNPRSEDDAWRGIVENYGDRAELDDDHRAEQSRDRLDDSGPPLVDPAAEPLTGPLTEPLTGSPAGPWVTDPDQDRFIPPPPPPLPTVSPRRLVAWLGLLAGPAALLVCLLVGVTLPTPVALILVAWFVGGFVYLVLSMPRGPRDPWDDGAQV